VITVFHLLGVLDAVEIMSSAGCAENSAAEA
jgi:hypothetical protein